MRQAVPWIVAGRYEIGEVVGHGGYGMVRRGVDRKTGQTVALKVLAADSGKDPHVVERMLREQQAMLALAGTCAVSAIDLCRLASGAPCLVMEWLDGRDLERQLTDWEAEGKRMNLELLLDIMRPLAETLGRAHELGIVHRDIKPANVFLTTNAVSSSAPGAVRLLDFGLSRMRSAAPLTAIGMVMGSPSYIPPETWAGNSSLIDHRADLYSLAVIVFRALAGQLPFETPSLVEKLKLVTTGERPSVRALRPDLPAATDDWMKRALAIQPEQRFQSARDFYDSLVQALGTAALPVGDEEVSGVRQKSSVATVAPAENRNVLSVAWQRATSLLSRFIGQKGAALGAEPERPGAASPEPNASSASDNPAETAQASVQHPDRPSVAWLDDSDVEDLPPSAAPNRRSVVAPKPKGEAKKRKTAPANQKKKPAATAKPKPAKKRKAKKTAPTARKAQPKKSKKTPKKR